jgi:PPOX class probable F420-dependent enzyme
VEEARRDAGVSVGERFGAASNRVYARIRHPQAFEAAAETGTAGDFSAFAGRKYALLTTFRRDGTPVPTPVWFGVAEGRLYVRSEAKVGKVKRIRNDAHVRVAPATVRGKPLGPTTEATARVLAPEEEERAEAALAANYGLFRRVYESGGERMSIDTLYLELTPAAG